MEIIYLLNNNIEPSEERTIDSIRMGLEKNSHKITVFSSWQYLKKDKIPGECDIVIVDQMKGVMFLEVKGGGIRINNGRFQQFQKNHWEDLTKKKKDPMNQAKEAKYEFEEQLEIRGIKKNIPRIWASSLPDYSNEGLWNSEYSPETIFFENDLDDFEKKYKKIWKYYESDTIRPRRLSNLEFQSIIEIFSPEINPKKTSDSKLIITRKRMEDATKDQIEAMDWMDANPQAKLFGGAGTGKTAIAMTKALQFSKNNIRTLFLCYNRLLKEDIESILRNSKANFDYLDILTIHEFPKYLSDIYKLSSTELSSFNFDELSDELEYLYIETEHEYKAIIIDEYQDIFYREKGLKLTNIIKNFLTDENNDYFYIFYDDNQKIYADISGNMNSVRLNVNWPLKQNLRNTRQIHKIARNLYEGIEYKTGNITGDDVNFSISNSHDTNSIIDEIDQLIKENVPQNFSLQDTAILTESFEIKQELDIYLRNTNKEYKNITIETIKRFKGLEKDFIILIGDNKVDSFNDLAYVGITRAKLKLHIICSSKEKAFILPRK